LLTRPEHYYEAARERLATATALFRTKDFVAAAYFAGVAVECMLRAFWRADEPFDARHDVGQLARGGFNDRLGSQAAQKAGAALSEVRARWQNDLRYYPASLYDAHIREINKRYSAYRFGKIEDRDRAEANTRRLLDQCGIIVQLGVVKWTSFETS
jgi:hypothetical protein